MSENMPMRLNHEEATRLAKEIREAIDAIEASWLKWVNGGGPTALGIEICHVLRIEAARRGPQEVAP